MVRNTDVWDFQAIGNDGVGRLVSVEGADAVPFAINRVYYIYGVPQGIRRGFHAHKALEQVLVAMHGSVRITLETVGEQDEVLLDTPEKALYIGPMVWREMHDFSHDAVLTVFASEHYDESDYYRDKSEWLEAATAYFSKR